MRWKNRGLTGGHFIEKEELGINCTLHGKISVTTIAVSAKKSSNKSCISLIENLFTIVQVHMALLLQNCWWYDCCHWQHPHSSLNKPGASRSWEFSRSRGVCESATKLEGRELSTRVMSGGGRVMSGGGRERVTGLGMEGSVQSSWSNYDWD